MRVRSLVILAASTWLAQSAAAQSNQPATLPYLDPTKPIPQRVADLVGRMTLEEKASQMMNHASAIPRLNVPEYDWWNEALHGVLAPNQPATVFPEPIGLAASFNTDLIHRMAEAIGDEGRVNYNMAVRAGRHALFEGLTFYTPNINIFRDPRWGRGQETYGEDPFLTARMGVAFITGLQGDDPRYLRAAATAKHYAVHSGPESARHGFDAQISRHDAEDTYLPAFRAAVVEGKVASVMCVYNAVNGVPGCASDSLLKETLRGQWNFKGFVASDCNAVTDIHVGHHYVKSAPEAGAAAVKAGLDSECGFGASNSADQKYVEAVKRGLLSEQDLATALKRSFATRFALGLFDPPALVAYAQSPDSLLDSDAHRMIALQAARESMVLLKNNGVLPLAASTRKISVVGPLADQLRAMLGNYNGLPSRATTVLAGIRKQFSGAQVTYEPGANFPDVTVTVPATVLQTDDGKPGLKTQYFAGSELAGAALFTRIDAQVGLKRGSAELPQGVPSFSIRWSGWLVPNESGKYKLGLYGASNTLSLDGTMLVDTRTRHAPVTRTVEMELVKGRRYAITVESSSGIEQMVNLIWSRVIPDATERAVAVARQAEVVVAVVGITSELESEQSQLDIPGFKAGDRTSIDLPQEEEGLLKALKATGKPLVVVLMNGSALSVNWAQQNADAIVEAWYPGEEGGAAVAETLAGVNNPAGRLPVTFYKGVQQLPPFEDYSMANRTYRYFQGQPLYPFGYGLSYASFSYDDLRLNTQRLGAGQTLVADVTLKNRSTIDGDEVAQLYLDFPQVPGAPRRALRGFQRVHLKAGESRRLSFTLSPRDLSSVDAAGNRRVAMGNYQLSIGGGQPGTGATIQQTRFSVAEATPVPDKAD